MALRHLRCSAARFARSFAITPYPRLLSTTPVSVRKTYDLTPDEVVRELDKFVVGQAEAKRSLAIALRDKWRRQQLPASFQEEVKPNNILLMGPTGCGKTEVARRLAKITRAPFLKVEATKYTEVGVVGKNTDSMVKDLVENAVQMEKEAMKSHYREGATAKAESIVLDILVDKLKTPRAELRNRLLKGELDEQMIEVRLSGRKKDPKMRQDDHLGMGAQMNDLMQMLQRMTGDAQKPAKPVSMRVKDALRELIEEEMDKSINMDEVAENAKRAAEERGVIFIDEIDKLAEKHMERSFRKGEGVQKELLAIVEGAVVDTAYGPVKTDHILFVAAGAFSSSKPSDLLPELQGRLPIRVQLKALTEEDFVRILTETEFNLLVQQQHLLKTEGVTVEFTEDGIRSIAKLSAELNKSVENIGARRLATVIARVMEELKFTAHWRNGQTVVIDEAYVTTQMADLQSSVDLRRYVL
eukprot:GILK01009209.1.p1 GENE.GILK01009209.1~~GILK01009209.1.p1  ORF type:complete len:486 (-),score=111.53 GILK01009209.1:83-1492(-)